MGDKFVPMTYAQMMASMLSIKSSVVSDNQAVIDQCTTPEQVNKIICAEVNSGVTPEEVKELPLEEEMQQLFMKLTGDVHKQRIEGLSRDATRYIEIATRCHRDADVNMREAAKKRHEINTLENKETNLAPEIKKIVADGWFTLEPEITRQRNSAADAAIYFSTNQVFLTQRKRSAGLDITVPMGRYLIRYAPQFCELNVLEHEDNLFVSSYYHPHVGHSGEVCWGTGHDKAMQALGNHKPSEAFSILRMVLTTYNDESPYSSLGEFNEVLDPRTRYTKPCDFKIYGEQAVWIRTSNLVNGVASSLIVDTADDGDKVGGETIVYPRTLVRVFRLLDNEGVRMPRSPYFVKLASGRYVALADRHLIEWASVSNTKKVPKDSPAATPDTRSVMNIFWGDVVRGTPQMAPAAATATATATAAAEAEAPTSYVGLDEATLQAQELAAEIEQDEDRGYI